MRKMPGLGAVLTQHGDGDGGSAASDLRAATPRVSIAWGRGNRLRLTYLNQQRTQQQQEVDAAAVTEGAGNKVLEVRVGSSDGDGASWRKLAYDSIPSFAMLQSRKQTFLRFGEGHFPSDWWETVLEFSRSISAVLGPSKGYSGTVVRSPLKKKKDMEGPSILKAIWDLLEVFYVDKHALSWLPEQLVDWMQSYNRVLLKGEPTIYTQLAALQLKLSTMRFPEDDREYWDGIASALAVGWLDVVMKFLRMHGSYQHDQIDDRQTENGLVEATAVLISKMPRLRSTPTNEELGITFTFKPEFSKAWEKWRNQIAKLDGSRYWLECTHQGTLDGLKRLLLVLLGDVNTLVEVTTHWMELLVAHFLFIRPFSVVSEGMLNIARKCVHTKPRQEHDELLDLILAIIGEDIEVVLVECSKLFNPWTLTHITELLSARSLQARAVLNEERDALGGLSLEELHKLVYAQLLFSHPCSWQMAPLYLAACSRRGRFVLEQLLLMQPIRYQRHLLKVLDVCRMYELQTVAEKLMRIMGVYSWKHERKGTGLCWLQRAHDSTRLSAAANELLSSLLIAVQDSNKLQELEGFIDLLGPQFEGSGGLTFLHRYKDFKVALHNFQESQVKYSGSEKPLVAGKDAAKSLMQLMRAAVMPPQFLLPLLQDSVVLLESRGGVVLSVAETNTLLIKLQGFVLSSDMLLENKEFFVSSTLNRVRLAIACNLGRAILQE